MATKVLRKQPPASNHWHSVAAEIDGRLESVRANVAAFFEAKHKNTDIHAKQQRFYETRANYMMAHAKQKFEEMLCNEDVFLLNATVENFESALSKGQLQLRKASQQRKTIALQERTKVVEVQKDVALIAAKVDSIGGKSASLNKENVNCTNELASAALQKQLESGRQDIAKFEQEKKAHRVKLLEQEATLQRLRRQLTALKETQEEITAKESSAIAGIHSVAPSSMDQNKMTRWYQELNAYLSRATGISISQNDFARSATDGCRRLKLTLFNSHILDIAFAPTGGIATIQLSPDNIYHADIDEAIITSQSALERSRLRWTVSEYCRRVSRAARLRNACTNVSNERCSATFDAKKGIIGLTLKLKADSDVILNCVVSRDFAERSDKITVTELQCEDVTEKECQTFMESIKHHGPFQKISKLAEAFARVIVSVI